MLHTILISILIIGALVCFFLAVLAWQQRPAISATIISFLLTAIGIYAIGYSLELTSTTLNEMLLAIRLEYLGVVQIAPLWMGMAFYYANQMEWIKPQRLIVFWIIPLIVLIAVFTNGYHHLYYTSVSLDQTGPFPTLRFERGPIYWFHIVYVYFVFATATLLLARQYLLPHVLYRRQATVMMGSSLFVIIVTGLHFAGITPLPNIDINPFAMIISSSVIGWGILNLRLIELTPVARETLFETLIDGVLVLDDQNRLVDFNPSAGRYLNLPADAVGQPLTKYLPAETRPIFENYKSEGTYQEISVGQNDVRYFEVFYDLLAERKNRPAGSLIVFHEITKRKEAEAHLQQTLTRYRMLADNSNDVIWTVDLDGRYTYISPAIERLRGYAPEEVLQQTLEEAFCPGSQPLLKNNLRSALDAARNGFPDPPQYLEIEQPCKNGGTIWTEITTRLMLDENGTPTGFMGVSRDIGERKRMQDQGEIAYEKLRAQMEEINALQVQLREQAIRDSLTSCYNRRYLDETIEREIARAGREGYPISLLMVDIDQFKKVNDTYGHPAGDAVLTAMGKLLRHRTRAGDIICRYGGEEFLMVLPNMVLEDALPRADGCRIDLMELETPYEGTKVKITVSIGVASFPTHGSTAAQVIQTADRALYLAKNSGRNCVRAPE